MMPDFPGEPVLLVPSPRTDAGQSMLQIKDAIFEHLILKAELSPLPNSFKIQIEP